MIMNPKNHLDTLRVQADSDIHTFVKRFVKKFKALFVDGSFSYRIEPRLIPEDYFPYKVILEIKIKK